MTNISDGKFNHGPKLGRIRLMVLGYFFLLWRVLLALFCSSVVFFCDSIVDKMLLRKLFKWNMYASPSPLSISWSKSVPIYQYSVEWWDFSYLLTFPFLWIIPMRKSDTKGRKSQRGKAVFLNASTSHLVVLHSGWWVIPCDRNWGSGYNEDRSCLVPGKNHQACLSASSLHLPVHRPPIPTTLSKKWQGVRTQKAKVFSTITLTTRTPHFQNTAVDRSW